MRADAPPFYFIYGEQTRDIDPRFVHVERVSDRNRFHEGHVRQHSHPHLHQLSFWLNANGSYAAEGGVHALNGHAITWMPAGVIHGFDVSKTTDSIVVSLSDDFVREYLGGIAADEVQALLRRPLVVPVPTDVAPRLHDAFVEIEREYAFPSWAQSHVIAALVRLAFITTARLAQSRESPPPRQASSGALFARFLALLDDHFREQRTVEAYAEMLGSTPYLLNRATHEGAGMRASHVIRARILQESKRLLLYTMLDVATVGFALGFEDAAHFGRMFRTATGTSPAQWRAQQRAAMAVSPSRD